MHPDTRSRRVWFQRQLEPDLSCYLRGSLYSPASHEMPALFRLRKVQIPKQLVITIIYLMLLTCPAFAFPAKNNSTSRSKPKVIVMEDNKRIIIRTEGCQPVPPEVLRARLGPFFDESKMRIDDDDSDILEGDKRSPQLQSVISTDDDDDDDDDDDNDDYDGAEDNIDYEKDLLKDLSNVNDISDSERGVDTVSVQKNYMRRKRQVNQFFDEIVEEDDDDDDDDDDIASDPRFLYQNLIYETISKRRSRQKRRTNTKSRFHPAWECEMKPYWRKMSKGYFPSQVYDGLCTQKKCFFGQYRCNRKRYAMKFLKRDPKELCNPLPLEGTTTTYEESWKVTTVKITVACECGLPSSGGRKRSRGRGRNE